MLCYDGRTPVITRLYTSLKLESEIPISLMDALKVLVRFHGQYLFRNLQQRHVHVLRAISVLQRRRNLTRSVNMITNYVVIHS